MLAEEHLTRRLFGDMLRRIWALPVPARLTRPRQRSPIGEEMDPSVERCLQIMPGKQASSQDRRSPRC